MNNIRRGNLWEIIANIEKIKNKLELLRDEEDEYIENIPENFQSSERYEKAVNARECMEEAVYSLEEAVNNIETATE